MIFSSREICGPVFLEDWHLELYDQDFAVIACMLPGYLREQKAIVRLDAGLPYYVGVIGRNTTLKKWDYKLTVISD